MREDGFYWVLVKVSEEWIIAEFVEGDWIGTRYATKVSDRYWQEIDERRITRGEVVQVALPPKMPLKPYQTINLGSKDYAAGWNACRRAMLDAAPKLDCWCHTCRPVTMTDMRFVVCPECGNKRCPKANDHRNTCTASNEHGQTGSAYPAAPNPGSDAVE